MAPLTQASAVSSCIRFIERSRVDFPHPDGPMMAVTARGWISMWMSRTPGLPLLYPAEKPLTVNLPGTDSEAALLLLMWSPRGGSPLAAVHARRRNQA